MRGARSFDPRSAARLVEAGVEAAERQGVPMAVAVVDLRGDLVAFGRTVDATPAAVDCAPAKARTAVWFGRPTADTVEFAARRPEVYQSIVGVSAAPLVLSMGGIPLVADGDTIGAVAAAGALRGAVDVEIAERMVAVWRDLVTDGG